MVDARGTLTPDEHRVLAFLADGPAVLGPRTASTTYSPPPRLWDSPTPAERLRAAARAPRVVRTVEVKAARRLAAAGFVLIDPGGTVTVRAHRLAKPLAGDPADGHLVGCSCGEPFDSWEAAEAHQAAAEAAT